MLECDGRDGIVVVGTASTGAEALARAAELAPDIVLVDVDLNGEGGFDLVVERACHVSSVTILISMRSPEDFQELVAGSPARGFLYKSDLSARAMREVLSNGGTGAPA